jgi:hypothetical protein
MIEWVTGVVAPAVAGVLALMFLENLFPPIPSEVIMPLAASPRRARRCRWSRRVIAGSSARCRQRVLYELSRHDRADRIRPMVGRDAAGSRWGDDLRKAEATLEK